MIDEYNGIKEGGIKANFYNDSSDIDILINSFSVLHEEEVILSTNDNFKDSVFIIMDRILFNLM